MLNTFTRFQLQLCNTVGHRPLVLTVKYSVAFLLVDVFYIIWTYKRSISIYMIVNVQVTAGYKVCFHA